MMISASDLVALEPGATILNVGRHAGSHEIRGAVRYRPADLLEVEHLALPIARERPVILYAEGGADDEVGKIAEKMSADGFVDVRVLDASLKEYERAGGELQDASMEQVVPPQRSSEVQNLDRRL